jgi:hypothetical protein
MSSSQLSSPDLAHLTLRFSIICPANTDYRGRQMSACATNNANVDGAGHIHSKDLEQLRYTSMKKHRSLQSFSGVQTLVRRCVDLRERRDVALKEAFKSLTQLETMAVSILATDAELDATESAYEEKVDALVELDKEYQTACDSVMPEVHLAILNGLKPVGEA